MEQAGEEFAGIIYAHLLRVTIGRAIDDIELVVEAVPAEEIRNTVVRIPL